MCDNNGDTFIATLHNKILASDRCNRSYLIIMLLNLVHTCLFREGFCTVCFGEKKGDAVTLPHIAQRKHAFWGGIKQMSKLNKLAPRNKVYF